MEYPCFRIRLSRGKATAVEVGYRVKGQDAGERRIHRGELPDRVVAEQHAAGVATHTHPVLAIHTVTVVELSYLDIVIAVLTGGEGDARSQAIAGAGIVVLGDEAAGVAVEAQVGVARGAEIAGLDPVALSGQGEEANIVGVVVTVIV